MRFSCTRPKAIGSKAVPPPASAGRCPGLSRGPPKQAVQDGICRQIDHRCTAAVHQTSGRQVFLQLFRVGLSSRGNERLSRQASTRRGQQQRHRRCQHQRVLPGRGQHHQRRQARCPASPPGCSKHKVVMGVFFVGPAGSPVQQHASAAPLFRRPFSPASLRQSSSSLRFQPGRQAVDHQHRKRTPVSYTPK